MIIKDRGFYQDEQSTRFIKFFSDNTFSEWFNYEGLSDDKINNELNRKHNSGEVSKWEQSDMFEIKEVDVTNGFAEDNYTCNGKIICNVFMSCVTDDIDTCKLYYVDVSESTEFTNNSGVLICPDCGGKVSRRIDKCIHCGCPMGIIRNNCGYEKASDNNKSNM